MLQAVVMSDSAVPPDTVLYTFISMSQLSLIYCPIGGQRVCPFPQQGASLPEQTASTLF